MSGHWTPVFWFEKRIPCFIGHGMSGDCFILDPVFVSFWNKREIPCYPEVLTDLA